MSSRLPLALVFVAALLGAAIGFLFGQGFGSVGASTGPVTVSIDAAPAAGSTPDRSGPVAMADGGGTRSDRSAGASAPSSWAPSPAALDRAIVGVGEPEIRADASGTGRIDGRVLDPSGRGVGGAVVMIDLETTPSRLADPSDIGALETGVPELETYLREQADAWAQMRARHRKVETAADGAYVVEGLDGEARYNVRATAEGHEVLPLGETRNVECGASVNFVAEPLHLVRIDLRDPDGAPMSQGAVQVRRGEDVRTYSWSADAPTLRLSPGPCALRGFSDPYAQTAWLNRDLDAEYASQEVSIDVTGYEETSTVVLQLVARVGIRGTTAGPAQTAANFGVKIAPLLDGEEPDFEALKQIEPGSWFAQRFAFFDLAPGRYVVAVGPHWGDVAAHEVVDVSVGITEVELQLEADDPTNEFTVRALGPNGDPVYLENLQYALRYEKGSRSGTMRLVRRDFDAAVYTFDSSDVIEDKIVESLTFTARDAIYGNKEVEIGPDERDLFVQYDAPVSIVTEVRGMAGAGLSGRLRVGVSRLDDDDDGRGNSNYWAAMNDSRDVPGSGLVRHDALAPGRYSVVLYIGSRWDSREAERTEVTVMEGEGSVLFDAPVLYEVNVTTAGLSEDSVLYLAAADDEDNRSARMRGWNGGGYQAQVDERGYARFRDVLAGRYRLSSNRSQNSIEITVPGGDVLFEARAHDALRVSISDVDGFLHQSGLRSNDLIVEVTGVTPGDGRAMQSAVNGMNGATSSITLTVMRDGAQVSITLPPYDRASGVPWGGRVRTTFAEQ